MRVIKKYSNRRLYDTSSSTYVNLEQLAEIIRSGEQVQIVDAQSGGDLTRSVLMQVILEVQGALDMMPIGLLHRMIRLSDSSPMLSMYRKQLGAGLELLDVQITRMEQHLNLIRPDVPPAAKPSEPPPEPPPQQPESPPEAGDDMDALRARLAALEARLGRSSDR